MKYDKNYFNCVYLLVDTINQTYYCGKAIDLNIRLYNHPHKKPNTTIYILENNCVACDMEYVWIYFFKHSHRKGWSCLNKDYNTGMRFRTASKNHGRIHAHHITGSNYYRFCKSNLIKDYSGLVK
jgi:hypothetical protein